MSSIKFDIGATRSMDVGKDLGAEIEISKRALLEWNKLNYFVPTKLPKGQQ